MPLKLMEISIDKAKQQKLFYVVTNGVIYHPKKKKCLILQRSKKEITHPGLWGVVGGKMEWNELIEKKITRWNHDVPNWEGLVEKSLLREAKEESGLEVTDPKYLRSVVFVRPDNVPVVMVVFALKFKKGKVMFPKEFDGYAWVDETEVNGYDCIEGIDQEVAETIKIFSTI